MSTSASPQLFVCDEVVPGVLHECDLYLNGIISPDLRKPFTQKHAAFIKPGVLTFYEKGHDLHAMSTFIAESLAQNQMFGRFEIHQPQRRRPYGSCGISNELLELIKTFYDIQIRSAEKISFVGVGSGCAFLEALFSFVGPTTAYDASNGRDRIDQEKNFMKVHMLPPNNLYGNAVDIFPDSVDLQNVILVCSWPRSSEAEFIRRYLKQNGQVIIFMHLYDSFPLDKTFVDDVELKTQLSSWTRFTALMNTPTGTATTIYLKDAGTHVGYTLQALWDDKKWNKDYCESLAWASNNLQVLVPAQNIPNLEYLESLASKGININYQDSEGLVLILSSTLFFVQ